MTRTDESKLLIVAALSLAGAGLWVAARQTADPAPDPAVATVPARRIEVASPRGGSGTPLAGPDLERALTAWRDLYAPRAAIDEAATQALKAERDAAAEAIMAGIGAAPASSVAEVLDRWRKAEARERLLLIDGVERNPSVEGVDTLETMYRECDARRICEEALAGLGASEGPGNTELLVEVLNGEDARAAQVAAMALYGEGEAADALIAAVYSEQPIEVRLEAVHSLGGIDTEAADAALAAAATSEKLEARVRVFAQKERERGG